MRRWLAAQDSQICDDLDADLKLLAKQHFQTLSHYRDSQERKEKIKKIRLTNFTVSTDSTRHPQPLSAEEDGGEGD